MSLINRQMIEVQSSFLLVDVYGKKLRENVFCGKNVFAVIESALTESAVTECSHRFPEF
jgi:hypothetical protein